MLGAILFVVACESETRSRVSRFIVGDDTCVRLASGWMCSPILDCTHCDVVGDFVLHFGACN